MKTIFKVTSNGAMNKFDDCYWDREDKAQKDLAERLVIVSRLPDNGCGCDVENIPIVGSDHYRLTWDGEILFEVRIEKVLLQ